MIGDVYDVASSLVVSEDQTSPSKRNKQPQKHGALLLPKLVSAGSPHVNWKAVRRWWDVVLGFSPPRRVDEAVAANSISRLPVRTAESSPLRSQVLEDVWDYARGVILDIMEKMLTSPQQAPSTPEEIRYLLILLASPLLMKPKEHPVRGEKRTRSVTLPSLHSSSGPSHRHPSPHRRHASPSRTRRPSKQNRLLSLILALLQTSLLNAIHISRSGSLAIPKTTFVDK